MTTHGDWAPIHAARWLGTSRKLLDWDLLSQSVRLDPYLVWADQTSGPALALEDPREPKIGVLVEFESVAAAAQRAPGGTSSPGRDSPVRAVRPVVTPLLSAAVSAKDLPDIVLNAALYKIVTFELSAPRVTEGAGRQINGRTFFAPKGFLLNLVLPPALLPFVSGPGKRKSLGKKSQEKTANCVPPLVCVIDDRCNFASHAFGQRVRWIWNQSTDDRWKKAGWLGPIASRADTGYGWFSEFPALNFQGATEVDRYRTAAYMYPTPQWSHGSAVLDLLAGHDLRLACVGPGVAHQEIGRQRWHADPPAQLLFVQLPISTVLDTSGGALSTHVIDGVQHAVERAENNQAIIVNISYGTYGGPHDGTSMFERALFELLEYYDGERPECHGKTLHVVMPAGNSHVQRCHAHEWLRPGQQMKLRWKVMPDDPTDNFVEIWIGADDAVSISVQPPFGEASPPIKKGRAWGWDSDNDGARAALVFPKDVAQGTKGTMALLAVGPTREGGYFDSNPLKRKEPQATSSQTGKKRLLKLAPHGVWTITICNLKESNGCADPCADVHAWVQRGDFAPGRGRETRGYMGRQPYFIDDGTGLVNPRFTLNGIATANHERLFVVGAMRHHDHCIPRYSSAGPNRNTVERCEGPDLVTFADESINLAGLLLRGTTAGSRVRVSGTSVAAPLVARMLYEHLQTGKKADSFCHAYSVEECRHTEPLGEGQPEWAEPFLRGVSRRLVPANPGGSLISPPLGSCSAPATPNGEVGSDSRRLPRDF